MEREELLQQILDGSNQIIQVSDLEDFTMIFANETARLYSSSYGKPCEGVHCYEYMLGFDHQCPFCPMLKMGDENVKEFEVENEQYIFAVKTIITELNGRKAFIEYARDITEIRRMEKNYHSQITNLMASVSDAQMVFHIDVTDDKVLSTAGVSYRVANILIGTNIETLNAMVSVYAGSEQQAEMYKEKLTRERFFEVYELGLSQISLDLDAKYNDGTMRPSRVCARLYLNPTNNHLECVLYGFDITNEVNNQKQLEQANAEMKAQVEEITRLNDELKKALDNFKEADYDRRRDFLTGLRNRRDLFELLQDVLSGKRENIRAMFMMDIDYFKLLNDHYGHEYGDECLKKIGECLNAYGSENDIYFYRYGGEEILGVCFGSEKDFVIIADEILNKIRGLNLKRDDIETGLVTVSLGYTTDNRRYEKMVDMADKAMYRAKDNGRNRAMCFEDIKNECDA